MTWKEMLLGEAIHIKHGYAFKSQYFSESGPFMLLTPGNFHEKGGFRIRPAKERFYTGDFPDIFLLEKNDLIVAMTEQGAGLLGSSAWIPESGKYLHNQRLGKIDVIDETKLHKKFLYHLFNTHAVRGQVSGSASGTKVRHTAPERIYQVKVRVPDIYTQTKIASTLDAYDDLIENNHRRIQLLEESARLLYKEWFVRLRFPGHEHVKIVDGVPEGWMHQSIEALAETIGGGTPSTKNSEYWDGGDITWFSPTDLTRNNCLFLIDSGKKITELGLSKSSAKLLPPKTILMTSRASIGYFGIYDEFCATNQGFISIIPKAEYLRWYLLFNLRSRVEEMISLAGGTTFKEINKSTFRAMRVIIPSQNLAEQFYAFFEDVYKQMKTIIKQTNKLTQARDLLLPRLMNGEISV